MKKALGPFVLGLLIGAAALYLALARPGLAGKTAPAAGGSASLASQLDAGGDLYLFYNPARIFPLFENFLRTIGESLPGGAEKAAPAIDQALGVIREFGLQDIDGLGLSSLALGPDLYRTRIALHHPAGKGQGLIWTVLGGEDRDLDLLGRLPAETAMASQVDFNLGRLLAWLKKTLPSGVSGQPDLAKGLADLEAKGVPLEKMIQSLAGPLGYVLTLDAGKKIALPAGEKSVEIPEPGMAFFFSVKDGTIFDFLKDKIPGASVSEKDGARRLQIAAPPSPIPLTPTMIEKGGTLVLAASEKLAEALLGGPGGKLADTEGFKALRRDLPMKGVGFSYLGPGFVTNLQDILAKMAPPASDPSAAVPSSVLKKIFPPNLEMLSIVQHGGEGLTSIAHHTVPMEELLFLQLSVLAGLSKNPAAAKIPAPGLKF